MEYTYDSYCLFHDSESTSLKYDAIKSWLKVNFNDTVVVAAAFSVLFRSDSRS